MARFPRKIWLLLIILLQAVTGIAGGIGAAGYFYGNKVIPGVEVAHIPLTGMTYEDASEELAKTVMPPRYITLTWTERTFVIPVYSEICTVEVGDVMHNVHNLGKFLGSRYYFLNMIRWVPLLASLNPTFSISENYLYSELERIKSEIDKTPQDARLVISGGSPSVLPEEPGWSLDLYQSKKNVDEYLKLGLPIGIPLQVNVEAPAITREEVPAFGCMISTYSTSLPDSGVEMKDNVILAVESINGCIIEPGEMFSFNKEISYHAAENGSHEAQGAIGGRQNAEFGDDISLVATALYQAALKGELEIAQRSGHSRPVTYVPLGQDVNVVPELIDLKFINNRDYPLLITGYAGNILSFSLYGAEESPERNVEIISDDIEILEMRLLEQPDPSIPKGERRLIQTGEIGYSVNVYRVIEEEGKETLKSLLYTDIYRPINEVVKVGTGDVIKEKK